MNTISGLDDGTRLTVRAQPRASRNAITLEPDGRVRVAITEPPVDDAANAAVCRFLAKQIGVPARDVALIQGERSRDKVLHIQGVSPQQVRERLGGQ